MRSLPSAQITPTIVFDTYWRFAAERLAMYYRRLGGEPGPWTKDQVLASYRFTNTYRASDRVSQYLIQEVQYRADRSQEPQEIFFRTLLFKIFNKIETWEALEHNHGPIKRSLDIEKIDETLSSLFSKNVKIYSGAYIMPAPLLGAKRKHTNHLKLISQMMDDRMPDRIRQAPDLASVYEKIFSYPGIGPFLAFQYAIDLNYSGMLDFDEADFVVAGPGALDGISKCFSSTGGLSPEALIHWVVERQDDELAARGITFPGLYGRKLQPIDCQNLFCEISKYARVAHPDVIGMAGRTRIKQGYRLNDRLLARPFFPPRWKLAFPVRTTSHNSLATSERQGAFL